MNGYAIIYLQGKEREVRLMNKTIVFDMDGTIVDFYGVANWLEYLQDKNPTPYIVAQPLVDMGTLNALLNVLKSMGWRVVVTSWLAGGSTKEFDSEVRNAKLDWLEKYDFPFDEVHLVKYGTTKANCTRKLGGYQILVDDNENVRNGWNLGVTINANENIIEEIKKIIISEWNIEK